MQIDFYPVEQSGKNAIHPVPATKKIPDWYKKMPPARRLRNRYNPKEREEYTIKKCIPVLDAFTTGYYLVTSYDAEWRVNNQGDHECLCPASLIDGGTKPITMHPFEQIRGMELGDLYNDYAYKFSNPFVIKTPPGYSCIFTHPFNQVSPFLTLTGVVDTDTHPLSVQFPFLMLKNYEGIIKAGTPIVQIIPFKRDEWDFSIKEPTRIDVQENSLSHEEFMKSRFTEDGENAGGEYKKKYRVKKRFF